METKPKALVFQAGNEGEPFTTSEVIAERTGIGHRKIKDAIRKYKNDLDGFGLLASYQAESTGGRPEEFYTLNEEQATFLMTLLKNTPVVVAFKKELVRQFFTMRQEIYRVKAAKTAIKPVRLTATDAIKALPESPHKAMKYKNYTDLVYLSAVGMTAKAIRAERGASKDAAASDFLTADELEQVSAMWNRVAVLLEAGMEYGQIKAVLVTMSNRGQTT